MLGCKSFRRKYRCSVIGFIAVICSIFLFGFSKILYSNHNSINELANRRNRSKSQDIPLIVWWNFMPPNLNDIITTEVGNCELSGNLSLWKEANVSNESSTFCNLKCVDYIAFSSTDDIILWQHN